MTEEVKRDRTREEILGKIGGLEADVENMKSDIRELGKMNTVIFELHGAIIKLSATLDNINSNMDTLSEQSQDTCKKVSDMKMELSLLKKDYTDSTQLKIEDKKAKFTFYGVILLGLFEIAKEITNILLH